MYQMMTEFASFGPIAFLWAVRLLWLSIGSIGAYEASREYLFNLSRYRRYRHSGGSKEIIASSRHWRSFWFLIAFGICFATGLASVLFLATAAPPRPEISVQSTILTILLEFMIICFWLSKHADRRGSREAEAYARSHQSIEEGEVAEEQPQKP